MAVTPLHSEAFSRGARMLRTALGPAIAGFLEDPSIVEVMLNPGGRLWIDRLSGGLEDTGHTPSAADGERIVRLMAHHVGAEVHAERPRVSAELHRCSALGPQDAEDPHCVAVWEENRQRFFGRPARPLSPQTPPGAAAPATPSKGDAR